MKKVLGWSAKFPIWKKIKTRNYSRLNKLQNAKNRNVLVPKLWPLKHSKGDRWNFTGELFKVSQKFGTTDEAQNFRIQKKWTTQNYGRQNKFPKTKNRNVLASKLRPVKNFKWWTMTLHRSYVKSGSSFAPHKWVHTRFFTS